MLRRIRILTFLIIVVTSLTSCGKYAELYETLEGLTIETVFPEAEGGATTISEAEDAIYEQQKALCEAMAEAYRLTDIEELRDKHPDINRNKMMSELSNHRQAMNNESLVLFIENAKIILADVKKNDINSYITECMDDVKKFYIDYYKLMNADEDDYKTVSKIFVSYAEAKNDFARRVLVENHELIVEAVMLTTEDYAEDESSLRANVTKSSEMVKALRDVFEGVEVNEEHRERINSANGKLINKTLESMRGASQAEKDAILSQFE